MTVLSTIGQYVQAILSGFKPAPATKPTNEFLQFIDAFPFSQVLAAALVEGANPLLDATAGAAILADVANSFFAGKTIPMAAASVALKVGIPAAVVAQTVFAPDPVHPADPTQFSRGGH
jgi:hypothetical protein